MPTLKYVQSVWLLKNKMKLYGQLKKEQDILDAEDMGLCPECSSPRTWGEYKEVGCMECYYQDYLKRTKQQIIK